MSKIDGLIRELCPNGVIHETLGIVCTIKTGQSVNKVDISNNPGGYPVINSGREPLGFIDKYNTENDPIGITTRGAGVGSVTWCDGRYFRGNLNYSATIKKPTKLIVRFLYYVLMQDQVGIQQLATYEGIPALNKSNLEKLLIPIPPLEVQKEIVNILDKFTQLEAELSAELSARRNQYEYYRNQLLTFDDPRYVRWTTLGEVAIKISSGGTPKTSVSSYYGGDIPWLRTQEVNFNDIWDTDVKISEAGLKNSSAKLIPENCVIIAMYGATVGKSAINKIPLSTNQACANIQVDSRVADYRYVFHWVNHNYKNIKALGTGSQTNINAQTVRDFKIPVPAISEQMRIVLALDKFDALVNDISSGLPAEIAARRKQYEYYRTKLLTFKEVE